MGACSRLSSPCCLSAAPPLSERPYSLGCFAGCPAGSKNCKLSGETGFTSTYIPTAAAGPRGTYTGVSTSPAGAVPNSSVTAMPIPTPSAPPTPVPAQQRAAENQSRSPLWVNGTVAVRLPEAWGGGLGVLGIDGELDALPNGSRDTLLLGLVLGEQGVDAAGTRRSVP